MPPVREQFWLPVLFIEPLLVMTYKLKRLPSITILREQVLASPSTEIPMGRVPPSHLLMIHARVLASSSVYYNNNNNSKTTILKV